MNADRIMQNMMQSMGMPFGMGLFGGFPSGPGPQGPPDPHARQQNANQFHHDPFSSLMPHGLMSPMSMMMMNPFAGMSQAMSGMANNGTNGGFSYCSSSVTSYTTDEHGRPQVYQQSNEIKQGPNGLKETKSSVRDSRTGHQELAIGHHLNEKAHVKKKSKNAYTGEEEQAEDFVNLDEAETETFEQNWMQQAQNLSSYNQLQYDGHHGRPSSSRLALTSSANEDHQPTHRRSAKVSSAKAAMKGKKKKSKEPKN